MSVPGSSALSYPTNFARVDSIPGAGPQSHGVPTDFDIDPVVGGGVSTLYDGAKDYNSGVNAVNRGISHPYLINNAKSFCAGDPYYHEALVFMHRIRKVNTNNPNVVPGENHLLSISQFNTWLKDPEGRKCYGKEKTAHLLKQEWRFAGSVKRPQANQRKINKDDAVPIVVGGRARIADIGRAYVPSKSEKVHRPRRGVPSQRDHLFLVYRRYNITRERDASLMIAIGSSSAPLAAPISPGGPSALVSTDISTDGIPNHYWQVHAKRVCVCVCADARVTDALLRIASHRLKYT